MLDLVQNLCFMVFVAQSVKFVVCKFLWAIVCYAILFFYYCYCRLWFLRFSMNSVSLYIFSSFTDLSSNTSKFAFILSFEDYYSHAILTSLVGTKEVKLDGGV
ncbi:hypothetical protein Cni_G18247 [Canna indica]|uniref:Uncharacterized protein n=1 Tax=Canna indica TaxID=4628 RepID=A0AAQ3QFW9_9LILI|nr:hypothetical protein Cni_G18247 [Canna indica]